jgi:hypothetical protein
MCVLHRHAVGRGIRGGGKKKERKKERNRLVK